MQAALNSSPIAPGDAIVGFSSTGQAAWEDAPNAGMGSNGLTSARHDGLGGEVHDGADLVLAQGTLEEGLVGDVAGDDLDAMDVARAMELGLGDAVADEADDVGAGLEESADEPGADESCGSGDEGGAVAPEVGGLGGGHAQVFQGAGPEAHMSLRAL